MVELENRRGKKLGMEVGTARERVLIALFMYVFGSEAVRFPPTSSHELDVYVESNPVSVKTKMGNGNAGVKLIWTVDWAKVDEFANTFVPTCHLLFVHINWETEEGGFYLIPLEVQKEVLNEIGRENFLRLPRRGTNPRGVELSSTALKLLKAHSGTFMLPIKWRRDPSLLVERALYGRWIELWDSL